VHSLRLKTYGEHLIHAVGNVATIEGIEGLALHDGKGHTTQADWPLDWLLSLRHRGRVSLSGGLEMLVACLDFRMELAAWASTDWGLTPRQA